MNKYYKYYKYKNKYLFLKNKLLNGGVEMNKDNLKNLKINDKLMFTFDKYNFEFIVSEEYEDNFKYVELKSTITNFRPLLIIHLYIDENYTHLSRITTNHQSEENEKITFDKLMNIYKCVSSYFGFEMMTLVDASMFQTTFENKNINFDALTYRIFTNKNSIYEKFEFKPNVNFDTIYNKHLKYFKNSYTENDYNEDKKLLYNSKIRDFYDYFNNIYNLLKSYKENYYDENKNVIGVNEDNNNKVIDNKKDKIDIINRCTIAKYNKLIRKLNTMDDIIKLFNDYGLDNYTRELINLITNDDTIYNKNTIISFMELINQNNILIENIDIQNLVMSNNLHCALIRIKIATQYMSSKDVKCYLCNDKEINVNIIDNLKNI